MLQRWAAYDPIQLFADHMQDLAGLCGIYLDVGDKDELGLSLLMKPFSDALTAAGIDHVYEVFDGTHVDKLYTRLGEALKYLSGVMTETNVEHGVQEKMPSEFHLSQNFPNPFNPVTTIQYYLSVPDHVRLSIFNHRRRHVCALVDENMASGSHTVKWNGRDKFGSPVPSGAYVYLFKTGKYTKAKKLLLVK